MFDVQKLERILHLKGFAASIRVTSRGHKEISAFRDGAGTLFVFDETDQNVHVQQYPIKWTHALPLTASFIEDCTTIHMIARECWYE